MLLMLVKRGTGRLWRDFQPDIFLSFRNLTVPAGIPIFANRGLLACMLKLRWLLVLNNKICMLRHTTLLSLPLGAFLRRRPLHGLILSTFRNFTLLLDELVVKVLQLHLLFLGHAVPNTQRDSLDRGASLGLALARRRGSFVGLAFDLRAHFLPMGGVRRSRLSLRLLLLVLPQLILLCLNQLL